MLQFLARTVVLIVVGFFTKDKNHYYQRHSVQSGPDKSLGDSDSKPYIFTPIPPTHTSQYVMYIIGITHHSTISLN